MPATKKAEAEGSGARGQLKQHSENPSKKKINKIKTNEQKLLIVDVL